ncbi:MAG: SGNH/GDSL hydrolase family protein, partial [Clostridia bacterium]|nr:SGNH/GDSL hydrolase family protein [Clostridia bacterium]
MIGGLVAMACINKPKSYDYYVKKGALGDGTNAENSIGTVENAFKGSNKVANKRDNVNINLLFSEDTEEFDTVISCESVNSNATIIIDNIKMENAKITFSNTVFNGNLNVKAVKASSLNVIKEGGLSFFGDAQFILNNAIKYTDDNSFEKLSSAEKNWVLYVSPEYIDYVNFSHKSGKFLISEGYTAKAYTKDRKLVATSKKGTLKLNAGVYNIAVTKDDVAESDKYAQYINYRGGYNEKLEDNKYLGALSNTYSKLTKDKKLKVVYFGGSVTAGSGASHGSYCWRGLIGEWLKNNFPEAEITNCNKALGETGTHLGVYRLKKAVSEEKPDLLFIEYSINDYYDKASYERASTQFETIVRQVREQLPECDIVT